MFIFPFFIDYNANEGSFLFESLWRVSKLRNEKMNELFFFESVNTMQNKRNSPTRRSADWGAEREATRGGDGEILLHMD
jgi:hypothetical protein